MRNFPACALGLVGIPVSTQYKEAVVVLPAGSSPLLTRELLYTAVTRASNRVTLIGSDEVIRHAIIRRVERATGLGARLARK